MDLRKSVLRYLHSVFDTDPQAVWGMRIAADTAFAWDVDALTLTLDNVTIPLGRFKTLDMVADDIRRAGYAVQVNPAVAHRTSAGLVDGAGNGTLAELSLQDSVLWSMSLPGALAQMQAQGAMVEAVDQLNFMHADGGWLDLWGRYFDVPRQDGQTDAVYADFIKREILRTRANGLSIQVAVKDWTGHDIIIREPWRELWVWDKSRWDGGDSVWQDGNEFTFGTIEPRGPVNAADWAEIVPVIQRNRAMGCYLLPPTFAINGAFVEAEPDPISVAFGWANVLGYLVNANLTLTVAAYVSVDSRLGFAVLGESPAWEGEWDERKWASGDRVYAIGYQRTNIPAS